MCKISRFFVPFATVYCLLNIIMAEIRAGFLWCLLFSKYYSKSSARCLFSKCYNGSLSMEDLQINIPRLSELSTSLNVMLQLRMSCCFVVHTLLLWCVDGTVV